jgi:hypothetical protein
MHKHVTKLELLEDTCYLGLVCFSLKYILIFCGTKNNCPKNSLVSKNSLFSNILNYFSHFQIVRSLQNQHCIISKPPLDHQRTIAGPSFEAPKKQEIKPEEGQPIGSINLYLFVHVIQFMSKSKQQGLHFRIKMARPIKKAPLPKPDPINFKKVHDLEI